MSLQTLHSLAAIRDGVFTTADAASVGLSEEQVLTLSRRGTVKRIHRGVYAFTGGGSEPSFRQLVRAACTATGGVASHWTAARLHGLREAPERPLHVTIRRGSGRRTPVGVIVHRTTSVRVKFAQAQELPVTPQGRTLVDLAAIGVEDRALHRYVSVLVSSKAVTLQSLTASVEHLRGVPGAPRARTLLAEIGGPVDSVLEDRFLSLLKAWGLPPAVPQLPVVVSGRRYRADFAWPTERVIVEVDSFAHHSSPEDFERDRLRENDFVANDWLVLRVTSRQIDAGATRLRAQLEAVLAARQGTAKAAKAG